MIKETRSKQRHRKKDRDGKCPKKSAGNNSINDLPVIYAVLTGESPNSWSYLAEEAEQLDQPKSQATME